MSSAAAISMRDVLPEIFRRMSMRPSDFAPRIFSCASTTQWDTFLKSRASKLFALLEQWKGNQLIDSCRRIAGKHWENTVKELKPHISQTTHKNAVQIFSLVLMPVEVTYFPENIKCTSPHQSLKDFLLADGDKSPDDLWWIPQGSEVDEMSVSWVVNFERRISIVIVETMANALTAPYVNVTRRGVKKSQYSVCQELIKVWLLVCERMTPVNA